MKHRCNDIWDRCLQIIADNVPAGSFKTWFVPIRPVKIENNIITVEVPSHFFYEYIEENYIDLLKKVLRREIGEHAKLEYVIVVNKSSKNGKVNLPSSVKPNTQNRPVAKPNSIKDKVHNPFVIPGIKKITVDSNLQKKHSFDNFIVGDCNRVASEAGHAIAQKPGETPFNPLFIYSKSGLGKTHVSQAIGIEAKKCYPEKTILYLSANKFKTQYTESIRKNTLNDFIHFYQMIDLLIIDDIHELTTEKTQNVFFHIFNHLHQSNKQLILTSDRPPIELEGIEERLLSRFKWGLSVELKTPDFQTRKAIFTAKAKQEGIEIAEEIIDYVCKHVKTSIRELEGILVSMVAHATINNQDVNLTLAESIVKQVVKNPQREVNVPYIKKKVSSFFNLTEENLVAKTRRREIVQARQIAMYFAREITKSSLTSIGAQIGNKNHATVLHACQTVENLMETDKKFRYLIEELRTILEE
ncbi:chromosomal replication initiator protein [Balneicella halophila]|uniref:Chromosomal replication initiator protein DnaA n=1 Tax=Balneicella halophila TaxID=1537566 RepID=A0A7L4UPJ6_BALHA|nr:chromosomal replication initiator protein DnaA [Balneicella halophila]PVX50964.1 chromosomal replication initiator protein [Balneicella halophila]